MENRPFYITFQERFFKKGEIIEAKNCKIKIIHGPERTWYKVLFQYLTFRLYKAPYTYPYKYKVKLI